MNPTEAKVADVVSAACRIPRERLEPQVHLDALGLDSLNLLEVGLAMRAAFDLPVDDADVARAQTVGDLARIVEELRTRDS